MKYATCLRRVNLSSNRINKLVEETVSDGLEGGQGHPPRLTIASLNLSFNAITDEAWEKFVNKKWSSLLLGSLKKLNLAYNSIVRGFRDVKMD